MRAWTPLPKVVQTPPLCKSEDFCRGGGLRADWGVWGADPLLTPLSAEIFRFTEGGGLHYFREGYKYGALFNN